ncbi:hypothetical protein XNC1_0076 [Xenorhabdus nematophila ATCC 19061]|uniref:Uncharacterized protein n=1 Tax=Xenorhabdus nematophila (strain ATCC 19061 / DSM 3370 / CCUG 14189 / LMG 1036 / NCIMB 9965 / AN6) TaxID=406817 RepID=D3VG74_XENNA|nr:hypothetical protein XNC1_0076 [Xenorhabdus nematophila ATCC 19061]
MSPTELNDYIRRLSSCRFVGCILKSIGDIYISVRAIIFLFYFFTRHKRKYEKKYTNEIYLVNFLY